MRHLLQNYTFASVFLGQVEEIGVSFFLTISSAANRLHGMGTLAWCCNTSTPAVSNTLRFQFDVTGDSHAVTVAFTAAQANALATSLVLEWARLVVILYLLQFLERQIEFRVRSLPLN